MTVLEKTIFNLLNIEYDDIFFNKKYIETLSDILDRIDLNEHKNIKIILADEYMAEITKNYLSNGNNIIDSFYLGLKKNTIKNTIKNSSKKYKNVKPEETDIKKLKAAIYAKIMRLKVKDFLTEKQKLKLLSLQQQYDALLVRPKRKKK